MNFFFLVLIITTSAISSTNVEGGRLATIDEMNATGTVAIVYENEGKETSSCTGVRIAPDLILTASHCVYKPFAFPKGVRQALNPLDQNVPVEKVKAIKFPYQDFYYRVNFEAGFIWDIALMILEDSSEAYVPQISKPIENDEFIQLGYGLDFHYPRKETFPLSALTHGWLDPEDFTTPYTFTVRNPKSSMRSGDSGGPVLRRLGSEYELVGILSSGDPRALSQIENGRTIYMSAYNFIDWVRGLTSENFYPEMSLENQFPREENEFITAENVTQIHNKLCSEISQKLGSEWYLSDTGVCLPKNEELCLKMRRGDINFSYFSVNWNPVSHRCED